MFCGALSAIICAVLLLTVNHCGTTVVPEMSIFSLTTDIRELGN